jgi:hypothetical protein
MGRKTKVTPGIELWLGAMTDSELAALAGIAQASIRRYRREEGLPRFLLRRNADRDEAICADLVAVQNAADVARKYGLTRERVRSIAEASGYRMTWTRKEDA